MAQNMCYETDHTIIRDVLMSDDNISIEDIQTAVIWLCNIAIAQERKIEELSAGYSPCN